MIIYELNETKKYIVFLDRYNNRYANANDAFPIFDYLRKKGRKDVYYFLFIYSQLYFELKKENNLENVIVIGEYNNENGKKILYQTLHYILHSKLIVYSYKSKFIVDIMRLTNYSLKSI